MDSSASQYEFTPEQNEVLESAARWVGVFAWIMIASSIIMTIGGVLSADEGSIGALIAAAVYFTVGMSFRGSASSMQEVVKTEGNDIPHLMAALDSLASAFQVMGILILIGVTSVALSLVVLGGMFPNGTP